MATRKARIRPSGQRGLAARDSTRGSGRLFAACKGRLARLRQALAAQRLDGLLVTNPKDTRYLTTFNSKDCILLVLEDRAALISDVRDEEAMQFLHGSGVAEPVIGTQHRLPGTVRDLCRKHGVRRLGIQSEHMTVAARAALVEQVGEKLLQETSGLIGAMRMRKDPIEIAAIEKAIGIHQAALAAALPELKLDMPELEFCALLEFEMKRRGAEGPSFGTMVASGARSSIIHYATSMAPIKPGLLLVDMGAIADGYCSDMTRTFLIGRISARLEAVYAIVLNAQQAAIDACRPGRTCAEIDSIARDLISAEGYGQHFGHGLGHGIGLDIHEAPRFNQLSGDTRLESGMVMTVEPGIYLPGIGGVRIEDDVLITDDGCRVLTSFPRDMNSMRMDLAGGGAGSGARPRSGRASAIKPVRKGGRGPASTRALARRPAAKRRRTSGRGA